MKNGKHIPMVSIGVPVYNGEKYLEECLNSIANQTFEDWECVIINNCSTDRSFEIASRFVTRDPRFRIVETKELLPVTDNWNFCYSSTNRDSRYFKIVPADDWLFPRFLSEMVDLLEKNPNVGFCSSYIIDDKQASCDGLDIIEGNIFAGKDLLVKHLKGELLVFGSANAVLFRNSYLEKLPYFPDIFQEDSFHMDTYLCYELLNMADMGFIFQVLSYTRRHNETITSSFAKVVKTWMYFQERVLYDYNTVEPQLKDYYTQHRHRYAYFLLKSRLLLNRKVVQWHNNHLERPIKTKEYLSAILRKILFKL